MAASRRRRLSTIVCSARLSRRSPPRSSRWRTTWPEADPVLLERDTVEIVVQVNGRVRERLHVPRDTSDDELVALARASERVQSHLDGAEIARTIVVPGKLVNFVT